MKLLFADINALYMNPTPNLAPLLMQTVNPETRFYGPGFVSPEEIDLGIEKWCERTGPYDAIVLGSWTPILVDSFEESLERRINFIKKYLVRNFQIKTALIFYKDIQKNLKNIDVPRKIFFGLAYDYYATSQSQVDKIEEFDLTLIAPNRQFCKRVEDLPEATKSEDAYKRKEQRLSNAWQDFVQKKPERVITATHFIAPDEFSYKALAERKNLISVPGVLYNLRKEAVVNLKKNGFSNNKYKRFATVYKIADHLGLRPYARAIPLKLFNYGFFQGLSNTKFVYTARGGFGTPIRKFFEIPAAGALLLCEPCFGYEELGFKDGEHYLKAEPKNLADRLDEIISDPDRAQVIANAGRKLVVSKHSLNARANQIRACLTELINGNYLGSYWNQGRFVVKKQDDDGSSCQIEV
jgi:hypothetical protein